MATRLYTAGAAPGSPAINSTWEASGGILRSAASITAADYVQQRNTTPAGTGNANDDYCHFQTIYGPVAAQTISGNVKAQMFAREGNAAVDARAQLVIRVMAPDFTTVRGIALATNTAALSHEFVVSSVDTSLDNRTFPLGGSTALTSTAATAGDYIVIEFGSRNHGTNTSGLRVVSGQPTASTDLPEDETTSASVSSGSTYRGWIEFSTTISPLTAAAAGNAAGTGAASNAKTTIKPTAGSAAGTGTANNATISFVPPPRSFVIDSVDYTDKTRGDSFTFTEAANRGEVGVGGMDLDDAANTLSVPALKAMQADEPAAGQSNKRMFTGFTHDRTTERGPQKVAGQRQWDVELVDLNTLLDDYVLTAAESADRPAETDYARVVWLLTTRLNTVAGVGSGVVPNSNTVTMEATDYRGRKARDVLAECSEAANKLHFVYDYGAGKKLYYDVATGTSLTSTLKISDVYADVDSSVTWAASNVNVHKSPDRIYSTIHLTYNGGTVTVTNAATASTYRTREAAVLDASINDVTLATAKANALLTGAAAELLEVSSISVLLPAANVNDIRQGQRLQIKLDRHGISSFTYYRCIRRTVQAAKGNSGASDVAYLVTLALASDVLASANGGRGGDDIWPNKSNANDDGATVIVDRGGITVTDGAITVTNGGATVIIDGSSDMFRISASGSQSVTGTALVDTASTTVSALTLAAAPASLLTYASSNSSTFNQYPSMTSLGSFDNLFAATTSGGAVTREFLAIDELLFGDVKLDGSSHPAVRISSYHTDGASTTRYQKYYLLAQTVF